MSHDQGPPLPESEDLFWHALNYRTAATQHAELMWQELLTCVERKVLAERERCAQLLDAAHEQRKHMDNYAAFYARMVREARLIDGPNVELSGRPR